MNVAEVVGMIGAVLRSTSDTIVLNDTRERSPQDAAIIAANVEKYRNRVENGCDIWTGQTLEDRE